MMTLFETLTRAQSGEAMQMMARRFDLSARQTEQAIEALMPAFSAGLKRNTADPAGVAGFMQALSTGRHARYFEDMQTAFQPPGIAEGNAILGHLFGSKAVSRAVAAQAEQATGVGRQVLERMLPVIALTLMGGLFKQSTGQVSPGPASGNPVVDMMEQLMAMRRQPARGSGGDPFAEALARMFGGMPEPEPEPGGNAYEELFGQMFETGRQTQESYRKGIDAIFDAYLRSVIKSR